MPRIFLSSSVTPGAGLIISGEKAHYLSAVLRCRQGDEIIITDGSGRSFTARLLSITRKEVSAEITEERIINAESGLHIALLQGLLKGEKMDLVIQKTTELGVSRITPVITERSQIRQTRRLTRWKKIAEEAATQSGRHVIPAISEPLDFDDLFGTGDPAGPGIIFWEESDQPLQPLIDQHRGSGQILLLTGPEGGFSRKEVDRAVAGGFAVASLGRRILRAETAAITAVSIAQYVLGDLGA